MRRWNLSLAIILSTVAEPAFADGPLPAGKPAGMRAAQTTTNGAIIISAAVLIAVAGLVVSEHPYTVPGQVSTTSTGH